jgi:putative membrane protein
MKYSINMLFRLAIVAMGLCLAGAVQGARANANNAGTPKTTPAGEKTDNAKASPTKQGDTLSMKDKAFMKDAAKGGMMEVEMGQMAEKEGKSADVKKFGSRMVTDHSKANNELMGIAKKKGFDLGNEKPKMDKMDSTNFDKEYMAAMVKDHEKDLSDFESEAKNGSDPEVKAFALKTSEMIKKHLAMAKETQGKLK